MKKSELKIEQLTIIHEAHSRCRDINDGLKDVESLLISEGKTGLESKQIIEDFVEEINPSMDDFLVNEPQPFYDVINASAIVGMSITAKAQLITHLQDGIGGRPNDRNK